MSTESKGYFPRICELFALWNYFIPFSACYTLKDCHGKNSCPMIIIKLAKKALDLLKVHGMLIHASSLHLHNHGLPTLWLWVEIQSFFCSLLQPKNKLCIVVRQFFCWCLIPLKSCLCITFKQPFGSVLCMTKKKALKVKKFDIMLVRLTSTRL